MAPTVKRPPDPPVRGIRVVVSPFHFRVPRYRRTINQTNTEKRSLVVGERGRAGLPNTQKARILSNTRVPRFQSPFYLSNRRQYDRFRRRPDATFRGWREGHRLRQSNAQRGQKEL